MIFHIHMAKLKKGLILSGGGGRGAYQAGVLKYLEEIQFVPDIICGTSVGAINSVAIASGMDSSHMIQLWKDIDNDSVYRVSFWKTIWSFLIRSFRPIADTTPLKRLIEEHIDLAKCQASKMKLYISAVNILTAELRYFSNADITVPHILASSAIPLVFPWQYINGIPHWDGGLMVNTPIQPAIEEGARDIIVVLLSPVGGKHELKLPRNRKESIERVFELSLIGSYQLVNAYIKKQNEKISQMTVIEEFLYSLTNQIKNLRIRTISPSQPLGLGSIMNFSRNQSIALIERGYEDAKKTLQSS